MSKYIKNNLESSSEETNGLKKSGRPKGSTKDIYNKERDIILKRFDFVLGMTKEKKFCVDDVDNDDEKINQILYMIDDIKKYFKCGRWSFFRNLNENQPKKPYLSLTKSIYDAQGYDAIQNVMKEKIGDSIKKRTYISFVKRNEV